jgi:hypothetical protein
VNSFNSWNSCWKLNVCLFPFSQFPPFSPRFKISEHFKSLFKMVQPQFTPLDKERADLQWSSYFQRGQPYLSHSSNTRSSYCRACAYTGQDNTKNCRQTFTPPAGFKLASPTSERRKNLHSIDCVATVSFNCYWCNTSSNTYVDTVHDKMSVYGWRIEKEAVVAQLKI